MKKLMLLRAMFTLALCLSVVSMVFGKAAAEPIDIKVILDGELLDFDVQPQIIDGRTMVPARVILEALGLEVEWYGETQTIWATRDNFGLRMDIGINTLYVGTFEWTTPPRGGGIFRAHHAHRVHLDVPPMITNGRTLVPLRAISEGMGAVVEWEGDTRTVIIETI
ncbi:MAG: copper amine oxidase N-terminal domain-containing protein [Defluviitaleaceae bacterium]|nr:copper amine oxidase N-terminal domain-containing protein [Defluviitaleaceae bacterium]